MVNAKLFRKLIEIVKKKSQTGSSQVFTAVEVWWTIANYVTYQVSIVELPSKRMNAMQINLLSFTILYNKPRVLLNLCTFHVLTIH